MESLGRLAGGVAHDFNNLLMVIQSASDLASSQLPSEHPVQVDLSDVRRAAERASALTQQLLTFARRQVLPSDASSVASKVVGDLVPILTRLCGPDILFDAELDSPRREVEASPVQLEQLLMNLCANARDAMPNGGRLGLRVRDRTLAGFEVADLKAGRYVEITVEDTGIGMSPEVQARMFEPFFTTKPAGRGTGLGLATVFGLVSQLRGNIAVRSSSGGGRPSRCCSPEAQGWPARESSKVGKLAEIGGEALDVLVIEDEDTVRALVVRISEQRRAPRGAGELDRAGHRRREGAGGALQRGGHRRRARLRRRDQRARAHHLASPEGGGGGGFRLQSEPRAHRGAQRSRGRVPREAVRRGRPAGRALHGARVWHRFQ